MLPLMAHSAALLLHKIPLIAESVDLLLLMLPLFRALLAGIINPHGGARRSSRSAGFNNLKDYERPRDKGW